MAGTEEMVGASAGKEEMEVLVEMVVALVGMEEMEEMVGHRHQRRAQCHPSATSSSHHATHHPGSTWDFRAKNGLM